MTPKWARHRHQRGLGLYLFILIMGFILPVVLILIGGSIQQNRFTLRDRNIKTAREMAESINNDFMNSFTEDWHRNSFDPQYLTHNNPTYAGIGSATSNMTVDRPLSKIRIQTVATYDKGGVLGVGHPLRAVKGVDALFFWTCDVMKFDYVWNQSVRVGNQISRDFVNNSLNSNSTIYVGGDFHVGDLDWNLRGNWVIKGRLTIPLDITETNPTLYCSQANMGANTMAFGTEINTFTPNTMRPNVFVLPPEGGGIPGDLGHYDFRRSTGIAVPFGESIQIQLTNLDQYITTPLDGSGIPTGAPSSTVNYFSSVQSATVPFTLAVQGGDVYLAASVISRPISLVVIGGNVSVLNDVNYAFGATNAGPDRSFALMTEGDLTFNKTLGSPQALVGFYGTTNGKLIIQGDQNINVTGTFYGPVASYFLPGGTTLTVAADPQLSRYPPPLYPRRPRVIMWDYVP